MVTQGYVNVPDVFGRDTQRIHDGTYFAAEVNAQSAGCGGWSRRQTLYGGDQAKGGAERIVCRT